MEVKIGKIYRHYKGNYYIVEALAKDSETLETLVIYRALYESGEVWARPIKNFTEKLNPALLTQTNQIHRFELQNIKSVIYK